MYSDWLVNMLVVVATMLAVIICVILHYEGLVLLSRRLTHLPMRARHKVVIGIAAVLLLHVLEIWVFGIVLWLLTQWPACGFILGAETLQIFDAIYFSATTFTTVGFGDLTPVGVIRFLAGTEALTGFVLITWSASFTYIEMERFWRASVR